MRKNPLLAAAVCLVAAVGLLFGLAVSATARAGPDTIYCLNGVSTTLPANIYAYGPFDLDSWGPDVPQGEHTGSLTEEKALAVIEDSPQGVFYYGFIWGVLSAHGGIWFIMTSLADAADLFKPGYSTNYVSRGPCEKAEVFIPTHVAVCKYLMRGDGTMGRFQEITVDDWNNPDGQYFDAPAANWVEGLGLTCDDPVALGYKPAGYNVAWGGKPDPGNDPNGVRASGFNNIYPYFTK